MVQISQSTVDAESIFSNMAVLDDSSVTVLTVHSFYCCLVSKHKVMHWKNTTFEEEVKSEKEEHHQSAF